MLSVIIPCYNAEETIGVQLDALSNQEFDGKWEIIVADNGSTDNSKTIVTQYQKKMENLQLLDASQKQGSAYARNQGVLMAKGDKIAFCDADDQVQQGWVKAIVDALEEYDFVASRFDTQALNIGNNSGRKLAQESGLQAYTYPPFLPHSGGCGIAIKKSVHDSVQGFDESMKRLMDTDYCWRIQLKGIQLHFVPEAIINIRFRESSTETFKQSFLWGEYNVFLYKRYMTQGMPKLTLKQGLSEWGKLLKRLRQLRYRDTRSAWLRVFFWRLGRISGCLKYRVVAI